MICYIDITQNMLFLSKFSINTEFTLLVSEIVTELNFADTGDALPNIHTKQSPTQIRTTSMYGSFAGDINLPSHKTVLPSISLLPPVLLLFLLANYCCITVTENVLFFSTALNIRLPTVGSSLPSL